MMTVRRVRKFSVVVVVLAVCLVATVASQLVRADQAGDYSLWSHSNLFAWCVVPFDAKKRGPEARAEMLEKLGFKTFAYDWRENDIPTFDAEIEALQKHGIKLLAWWFPLDADNPLAKSTLEIFKRHDVHPQLWVMQSNSTTPKTAEGWGNLLPPGFPIPKSGEEFEKLSPENKAVYQKAIAQFNANTWPKTPVEQQARVDQEAERIRALVKLAGPYGCKVELYNHNGWFGVEENELAIIARLKEMGVTSVGMVYNFSHARDTAHDETTNFAPLWDKIKSYVVAINITGTNMNGSLIYPSQGDRELEMMRTIQDSGWKGPVGLIAEKGGDAEVTLRNYLIGLDWLASELKQSGSGGPRPFPAVH